MVSDHFLVRELPGCPEKRTIKRLLLPKSKLFYVMSKLEAIFNAIYYQLNKFIFWGVI